MKRYKAASILMLIHGGFMEIGGCLCLIPILLSGSDAFGVGRYFSFIVPYLQGAALPDDVEMPNAKTLAAIEEVENMIETGKGEHFEGSTDDFFAQLAAEG